jgi:titin
MGTFWTVGRQTDRTIRRRQDRRRLPLIEDLEGRQLLSTFDVKNTSDNTSTTETGSLWEAIYDSNNSPSATPNTIIFEIPGNGIQTIKITSALPTITQPIILDGFTQPGTGSGPTPGIELNGDNVASVGVDLASSGSTIEGLAIVDFTLDGVQINSASDNLITDNYIGVTTAGAPDGNGGNGVTIQGNSSGNTIGGTASDTGNLISANGANGIEIGNNPLGNPPAGTPSGNLVEKNHIGTDSSGNGDDSGKMANQKNGVYITEGSTDNTIGATTSGAYNVISNNEGNGVDIDDSSSGNLVAGNRIGTEAKGTGALKNSLDGVLIAGGASSNTIGGTGTNAFNLISGNQDNGISLDDANDNLVLGNLVGTQLDGTDPLANFGYGILVHAGAADNTIGGTASDAGNTVSGNGLSGIYITSGASDNLLEGNWIGTNQGGTASLPNVLSGVEISDATSTGNTIGGSVTGAGNVISGNKQYGVKLDSASATLLEGNWIGTKSGGTAALPNHFDGLLVNGANDTTIGGSVTGAGNTISGNSDYGVHICGNATGSLLEGNWIGTNASGSHDLSNGWDGIIIDGASNNTIGGTTALTGNTISFNKWDGISISSNGKEVGNLVEGNVIDSNGSGGTQPDERAGVYLYGAGAATNTIGGAATGAANQISHNKNYGVYLNNTGDANVIEDDVIDYDGDYGVYANLAPSTTVMGCTLEYDTDWGIYASNCGTDSVFSPNTLENDGNKDKVHL